ncbi:MAG: hypothetical protein KIT69_02775 [Propionibacteriaceae bacterium]|nr:hypothetical protein [Propionibacteriaceae bacterium]
MSENTVNGGAAKSKSGKKFEKAVGTRAEVMHGTASHTSGGLHKEDLKYNNQGKIVSKKASDRAKKEKRLEKAGYKTKKGEFGAFKDGKKISNKKKK